jgi:hypothetical protein
MEGGPFMTCESFLEGFTEFRDGVATDAFRRDAEEHLKTCPDCRHYQRVVERGLDVLRDDQPLEVPEDFRPRLRHRLFHVDDEAALHRHINSGATGLAVLSIALVLSVVVWSPLLRPDAPVVQLSPIVVSRPPAPLRLEPAGIPLDDEPAGSPAADADLWHDAHVLLFQYSALSQRYRQRALLRRAGLNEDR